MRDVREGTLWQHVLDDVSVWGVTGPMYDDVGMPCVVVTGALVEDVKAGLWLLAGITPLGKQAAIEAALAAKVEEGRDA